MYKDSDGRICGSQWGIFAQVILPLPIINCAAQCVLCSHFGIDWNVHEFFAPETLLFSCSNLFSVIDIHSTGSWSKWLLVLGNLRASTLQVRSLNDHLFSSPKTFVFRGLLCVSENFCFQGWQFVFCHELIEQLQADKRVQRGQDVFCWNGQIR